MRPWLRCIGCWPYRNNEILYEKCRKSCNPHLKMSSIAPVSITLPDSSRYIKGDKLYIEKSQYFAMTTILPASITVPSTRDYIKGNIIYIDCRNCFGHRRNPLCKYGCDRYIKLTNSNVKRESKYLTITDVAPVSITVPVTSANIKVNKMYIDCKSCFSVKRGPLCRYGCGRFIRLTTSKSKSKRVTDQTSSKKPYTYQQYVFVIGGALIIAVVAILGFLQLRKSTKSRTIRYYKTNIAVITKV